MFQWCALKENQWSAIDQSVRKSGTNFSVILGSIKVKGLITKKAS